MCVYAYDWGEHIHIFTSFYYASLYCMLQVSCFIIWRFGATLDSFEGSRLCVGSNCRCSGNSENQNKKGGWRGDWLAAVSWWNLGGWGAASFGWAKTVASWDEICSRWRCHEQGWNDNKGFQILLIVSWKSWSRKGEDWLTRKNSSMAKMLLNDISCSTEVICEGVSRRCGG